MAIAEHEYLNAAAARDDAISDVESHVEVLLSALLRETAKALLEPADKLNPGRLHDHNYGHGVRFDIVQVKKIAAEIASHAKEMLESELYPSGDLSHEVNDKAESACRRYKTRCDADDIVNFALKNVIG